MRPDMEDVIAKSRRTARSSARAEKGYRKRFGRMGYDELPASEPIRRGEGVPRGWARPRDNAMERFLRRQVGRPWNKIFSEICAGAGGLLRSAAERLVELNVVLEDGAPFTLALGGRQPVHGLYVCPNTGLLRNRTVRLRRR